MRKCNSAKNCRRIKWRNVKAGSTVTAASPPSSSIVYWWFLFCIFQWKELVLWREKRNSNQASYSDIFCDFLARRFNKLCVVYSHSSTTTKHSVRVRIQSILFSQIVHKLKISHFLWMNLMMNERAADTHYSLFFQWNGCSVDVWTVWIL